MIIKISISDSLYVDDFEKELDVVGGSESELELCDEAMEYIEGIRKLINKEAKIESDVLHDCHAQGEDGHCDHPSHGPK